MARPVKPSFLVVRRVSDWLSNENSSPRAIYRPLVLFDDAQELWRDKVVESNPG